MKKRIQSIFSLCLVMAFIFSNSSAVIAKDTSGQSKECTDYVLAYYDIATGVETMLTAKEAKARFGLNVNPNTLAISAEPQKATETIEKKKLTEEEAKDIAIANKRGEEYFKKENAALSITNRKQELSPEFAAQAASTTSETRTVVTNMHKQPYYSVAKIYTNDQWIGTGFAVGKNLLAAARHSIQYDGEWVSSVTAYFGFENNNNTYTYKANNAVGYICYPTEQIGSQIKDWVFVVWGTNTVSYTGCFGMDGSAGTGTSVKTAGYPQDLDNGNRMYECTGTITSSSDYDFWTNLRVNNGQSGSPVYKETANGIYALGIVTGSWFPKNSSQARRIDSGIIGWLCDNGYV